MAKKKTNLKNKNKKLSNTPFKTLEELRAAEKEIDFETWARFATHRSFLKHLFADENEKIRKEFETGMRCQINRNAKSNQNNAIRVYYKKGTGVLAEIIVKNLEDDRLLVMNLTTNMMYAFGSLFYEISGLKKADLGLEEAKNPYNLSWAKKT